MEAGTFLKQHKVFRIEQFEAATGLSGSGRKASLDYHRKRGHVLPVRRGLYWVVPPGHRPETCPVDPFLIAGHVSVNAVLAYHSALELHGRAYSSFNEIQFLVSSNLRPFEFRGTRYRPLTIPPALVRKHQQELGLESVDRFGTPIKVTGLERCLVDVLDRPELSGGWEEAWRSLDMIEYLDLPAVCHYVSALGNATTAAKTGWYLEQNRQRLMVDDHTLEILRKRAPAKPHYVHRGSHEPTRFLSRWNLVVPASLADQSWEELI
ncbi:transcriptional regulator [Natronospira sp.]|uniref:type IV toxin-antitoxin system AbiEi family antitoxin domain-containing protein n=1 Tax=Natronospira sp. TaxID=2024970 RepID=UPI003872BEC6